MFLEEYKCDIAIYADDNTPYIYDADLNIFTRKLKDCTMKLFKWFKEYHVKGNGDKRHLLITTDKSMYRR